MKKWETKFSEILVFLIIIVVGLLYLTTPFQGEQALYTVGAKRINGNGILYRDFWDWKQPGIYVFYLIAGKLFSFTEVGIHLFDFLYWIIFSIFIWYALKSLNFFNHKLIQLLIPLFLISIYYGGSRTTCLTQVESLIGFPLFMSLFFLEKAIEKPNLRFLFLFTTGLLAFIVFYFKMLLVPIVGFFCVNIYWIHIYSKKDLIKKTINFFLPILLGLLLPILILFIYYSINNILDDVIKTWFIYPMQLFTENIDRFYRHVVLHETLKWFITTYSVIIFMAFIGVLVTFRKKHVNSLLINLLTWFILGSIIILIQTTSWWDYHFQLLYIPLVFFCAKGLEYLWIIFKKEIILRKSRTVKAIVFSFTVFLILFPVMFNIMTKIILLKEHGFAIGKENIRNYMRSKNYHYDEIVQEIEFLKAPSSKQGDIIVMGNPLYYQISGRNHAIINACWGLENYFPELWNRLYVQIRDAKSPYIFIKDSNFERITKNKPEILQFINNTYSELKSTDRGTWYVINN